MRRIFKLPANRPYWVWDSKIGAYWSYDPYGNNIKQLSSIIIDEAYSYGGVALFPVPEYLRVDIGL